MFSYKTGREPESNLPQRISDLLGVPASNIQEFEHIATEGFPATAIDALGLNGFTEKEIEWIVSRVSLSKQGRLSPSESGRLLQLATTYCLAELVLGNQQEAWEWLRSSRMAYGGLSAIDLAKSKAGAVHVRELLSLLGSAEPQDVAE